MHALACPSTYYSYSILQNYFIRKKNIIRREMGSSTNSQHVEDEGHVVLFPFMSKGHTIPLLHLSRLFLARRLRVTIFTTPANRPFINQSLADTSASVISLPFPQSISPKIPTGVESTDKLPSLDLFFTFALTTGHMQPDFERALHTLPRVRFMVSDAFLWWTLDSADKLGFPRFVFYGFSNYALSVFKVVAENRLVHGPESDDELITVTRFPWIKITRKDIHEAFTKDDHDQPSQASEFNMKAEVAESRSFGMIVNSFYELEPVFTDYWNSECEPKVWCVGPLCLVAQDEPHDDHHDKPIWIEWLDEKLEEGSWVLYVAFGTQAELSAEQLQEIAKGLENSNINFLWVIRSEGSEETAAWDINGFEERVNGRGMVVKEWVDQRRILMHESVKGFVSHCGWNSVLESICAGVPILAWPMSAEQPLNARMVVEEIKVGVRVETCDGSVKGFVKSEGLEKMVKELMEGEKGEEVRKKVKEFAELGNKAVKEGGSSWLTLQSLIDETTLSSKKLDDESGPHNE